MKPRARSSAGFAGAVDGGEVRKGGAAPLRDVLWRRDADRMKPRARSSAGFAGAVDGGGSEGGGAPSETSYGDAMLIA